MPREDAADDRTLECDKVGKDTIPHYGELSKAGTPSKARAWTPAGCPAGQQTGFPVHEALAAIMENSRWQSSRPDRSVLHVTPTISLRGIPATAHEYVVNGRTPLEWAVDRLHIRKDKKSGIVNDPNAWFAENPAELVAYLKRLVHVSVETLVNSPSESFDKFVE